MRMRDELIHDINCLNFEDMDMYFFYIKDLLENNETIGNEVVGQVQYFIDELESIKKYLIELGYKK